MPVFDGWRPRLGLCIEWAGLLTSVNIPLRGPLNNQTPGIKIKIGQDSVYAVIGLQHAPGEADPFSRARRCGSLMFEAAHLFEFDNLGRRISATQAHQHRA
jgi:hypothetical protein